MGYRNDQFYKLGTMSSGEREGWEYITDGSSHWAHSANNPPFIYPNRDIRVYDSKGRPETKLLKRGFMRNIPRLESEPQFKCQFQFNPQTLTQDVSYSESIYNHFLRDPGSFAQPQAGNGTMAFTILFDRSMEINNPVGTGGATYDPARGGYITQDGNAKPDIRNPWETGSPQYVGVLRDIAALYSVIGQGVNSTELEAQLEAAKTMIKSEALSLGPDSSQAFGSDEYNEAIARIDAAFEQQVGNYAFLAPKPVRMVFSSLYIVEGYVTTSSVTFSKFNSSYVPIQAQVHLTMSVQHIGFAKSETYTTYSIEEAKKFREGQEEAVRQGNLASLEGAKESLTNWKLTLNGDNGAGILQPNQLDDSALSPPKPNNIYISADASTNKFDAVEALFDEGATTIDIRAEFLMWTDIPPSRSASKPSPKVVYYMAPATVTTKEEFDKLMGPGYIDGLAKPVTRFSPVTQYGGNWSYLFNLTIQVTHNGGRLTGVGVAQRSFTPGGVNDWGERIDENVALSWSASGDPLSTTPLAPQINAPSAGTPSQVGSTPS